MEGMTRMRAATKTRTTMKDKPTVTIQFNSEAEMVNCFLDLHKLVDDSDMRSFGVGNIILSSHLLSDGSIASVIKKYNGDSLGLSKDVSALNLLQNADSSGFDLDAIADHCERDLDQMEKDKIRFLALT